jgi:hypothetical protein
MTLARFLNQPLELHKNQHTTLDQYGNQVPGDVSVIQIVGYLEQVQSTEYLNDRDTVVTSWQAYFPAGTDVNAFDRIVFGGQTFEVDGAPWQVYNPRIGSVSHIQAQLKVVL